MWWPSFKGKEALKIRKGGLSHLCGLKYATTIPDWQLYKGMNMAIQTSAQFVVLWVSATHISWQYLKGICTAEKATWGPFTDSVVFMMPFSSVNYILCFVRWITSKYLLTVLTKSLLTIHRPDITWDRHLCQRHWMLGQVSSTQHVGFDLHKDLLKIPFDLVVPESFWL